ncbi:MAG: hypothetical protein PHU81_02415 [Acidobacteriota bacterium]|nr:hypothetical protein [Acidobacteriota bacterium]
MERRAKKGKKEAYIKFWVRSLFSELKREGELDILTGPHILNFSLPASAIQSI